MNRDRWQKILESHWAPHIYAFTFDSAQPASKIHARMFAPALGIVEDPATGAAAVALAGYLASRDQTGADQLNWTIVQGVEMGRRSILEVEADRHNSTVTAIRVGGAAVIVSAGEMEVPTAL